MKERDNNKSKMDNGRKTKNKFCHGLAVVSLLASVAVVVKGLFTPSAFLWLLVTLPFYIVAVIAENDDGDDPSDPPVYPFPGMFD